MLTNRVAVVPLSIEAHVAPRSVDVRPGDGAGELAVGVEYDQAAVALGFRGAVDGGRAANDDPAAFQHRHRGCQTDAAGTAVELTGQSREHGGLLGRRVVVDDGRPRALQIRDVVEVVDQHVVPMDDARRNRRHHDRVGIEIAVVRHGRGQRAVAMDGLEKALLILRRGHRRGEREQGQNGKAIRVTCDIVGFLSHCAGVDLQMRMICIR